jgi:hypothetical protein
VDEGDDDDVKKLLGEAMMRGFGRMSCGDGLGE